MELPTIVTVAAPVVGAFAAISDEIARSLTLRTETRVRETECTVPIIGMCPGLPSGCLVHIALSETHVDACSPVRRILNRTDTWSWRTPTPTMVTDTAPLLGALSAIADDTR